MRVKTQNRKKVITLFEHQNCPYERFLEFNKEEILESIEELNQASKTKLLNLGHDHLSSTQFVGMIQVGNLIFEILPKIDYAIGEGNSDTEYQSATNNLLVMLAYAYNIKFDSKTLSSLKNISGTWYDLLIRFFSMTLHQEIEKGLSRNYQIREDVLPYIRGRWEISQQIRKHAYSRENFDLSFDEFTPDILLNRIFKTTTKILLAQTTDNVSRRLLLDIISWLEDVKELIGIEKDTFNQIHFSRLNERFKPAYHLAKLFLMGQSLQVRSGETNAFAFVFDMNDLFEGFITQFLIKHRLKIFRNIDNKPNVFPQLSDASTYLAKDEFGRRKIQLQPDIVLKDPISQANKLIIDTKYKRLDFLKADPNISPADIYQMLAYSIRLTCDDVILLYPRPGPNENITYRITIPRDQKETTIFIRTVNLHQPLEEENLLITELSSILRPIIGG